MLRLSLTLLLFFSLTTNGESQRRFYVTEDLADEWLRWQDEDYVAVDNPFGLSTIYLKLDGDKFQGDFLRIRSSDPYYIFVNGKISGEYVGESVHAIDSLSQLLMGGRPLVAIHQKKINARDLKTEVVSARRPMDDSLSATRPYSHLRDFVALCGLVIIILFLFSAKINPKLASDYFSFTRMFSLREADDSQAASRLTGGSNILFYVLCSLLISFYLIIIIQHLPQDFLLPLRFRATGFWLLWWQWLKLSVVVFFFFLLKLALIIALTRLFGMRGMARFHFFNWVRILLVFFGASTVILFIYFVSRGASSELYVGFLAMVVAVLVGWIVMAFLKLSGKSGHSVFHLFSYLCATEIIPLLITVKVLFQ